MIFSPVIPVALLVIAGLALVAFAIVGAVRARSRGIRVSWLLRIVMVLLLVIIAVQPAFPGSQRGPSATGGLEVYFAIDTTSSMAAEDYNGKSPRLDGVKADVTSIADSLVGAQFSLVTFDAAAVQRVPLTTDATALDSAVNVLTQEVTQYSRGSSIDEPVTMLTSILADAQKKNPGNRRVLFYVGDGEQTSDTTPGSFAALAPLISGGGVIGYGTAAGGRMHAFNGFASDFSKLGYIKDNSKTPATDALSMIDEKALGTIAQQLGVTYTHRTQPGSTTAITSGLSVGSLTVKPGKPGGPFELYWIFAIALGGLVLYELVRLSGTVLELRRDSRRRAEVE